MIDLKQFEFWFIGGSRRRARLRRAEAYCPGRLS
jgi:hypothetical protein